jgi:hypothetical protein
MRLEQAYHLLTGRHRLAIRPEQTSVSACARQTILSTADAISMRKSDQRLPDPPPS